MSPEKFDNAYALTPASNNLFRRSEGRLLIREDCESFHGIVAKFLQAEIRSCLDIISPTVSMLCGRVHEEKKNDWGKLRSLVKYLKFTKDLHLILSCDGLALSRWNMDASFVVQEDFKTHSGGLMMISQKGGAMTSGSTKQNLNTRNATESGIIVVDDFHPTYYGHCVL